MADRGAAPAADLQRGAEPRPGVVGGEIAGEWYNSLRTRRGGTGTVRRARDQVLERELAAKELYLLADGSGERRTPAGRAVRTAAKVPHPYVVGVHDPVGRDGRSRIVRELVEGPSLARRIAASGPLTPRHTAATAPRVMPGWWRHSGHGTEFGGIDKVISHSSAQFHSEYHYGKYVAPGLADL
ncbi:hypothetical protein ACIOWG_09360 [Streptomyces sp. NPDC087658]|uniref:hypothetical protein n=1 Tax=Streptomyces sp. NPDC087658 TaxID=3365800 RepID=UPI0038018981